MDSGKLKNSVKKHFGIILEGLKAEDRELREISKRFKYEPNEYTGGGIYCLEEKHHQYLLFKSLLKSGNFQVYIEEPYEKGKGKCDLYLYDPNSKADIWIEIKVPGSWEIMEHKGAFRKWIKPDLIKLKKLRQPETLKYLLLTWIGENKPSKSKWKNWFENNLKGIKFNPSLFAHFRTTFSDGKKFCQGYCTTCFLKVQ